MTVLGNVSIAYGTTGTLCFAHKLMLTVWPSVITHCVCVCVHRTDANVHAHRNKCRLSCEVVVKLSNTPIVE